LDEEGDGDESETEQLGFSELWLGTLMLVQQDVNLWAFVSTGIPLHSGHYVVLSLSYCSIALLIIVQ
jgi:hypothetical protein